VEAGCIEDLNNAVLEFDTRPDGGAW